MLERRYTVIAARPAVLGEVKLALHDLITVINSIFANTE